MIITQLLIISLFSSRKTIIFKKENATLSQIWPRATRYLKVAFGNLVDYGKIENVLTLKSDLVMKL